MRTLINILEIYPYLYLFGPFFGARNFHFRGKKQKWQVQSFKERQVKSEKPQNGCIILSQCKQNQKADRFSKS